MLSFRRSFSVKRLGIRYRTVDYVHAAFRIRVIESTGDVTFDERLLFPTVAWTGFGDRPRLDVNLLGSTRSNENGVSRQTERGQYVIGRALDSLYTRAEGEERLCLCIEWNLGSLGTQAPFGLPCGTLSDGEIRELKDAAARLLAPPGSEAERSTLPTIATLIARLRSAGLPFDAWRARDLVADVPKNLQSVADALGHQLSRLDARPSSRHLEATLGLSRRRVGELVSEVATTYGFNGTDWRSMRDRWRIFVSALAMSHRDARTEEVAEAVGYGSPIAFCQAYRNAGLPSPGQVRNALAQLA